MRENPIRTRREALGISAAELAMAMGVSAALVGLWERGCYIPPPRRQLRLAQLLHVDEANLASDLAEFRSQITQRAREKLDAAVPV